MDFIKTNPYSLLVLPLCWGIYEIRRLRYQLLDMLTLGREYQSIAKNLNQKIDDVSSNKLDTFPVVKDIQILTKKINKIFNIPDEINEINKNNEINEINEINKNK